jgi:hypothetical protein
MVMATQIKRFNAFVTVRVVSLSGLKTLSFPLTAKSYDKEQGMGKIGILETVKY